ncbi:alpha/beta fold hydrolase [Paenibacillus sp. M1]|uniref:Alpha/beta fold hydrolase n=1 Tax=Paenibacillus haidiansis TaxID=1574488 RepID=A0ABU7VN85_9BACL
MKLFCLPYAGGSAVSIYNPWKAKLADADIDVIPVELPGRGRRIREACLSSLREMVEDSCITVAENCGDEPYGLFGYSMGALIAYELYYTLKCQGFNTPARMLLAAKSPPDVQVKRRLHELPDEAFKREICKLGGTPPAVLDDPELAEIFLPVLRADYTALENYEFRPYKEKLRADVSILYGMDDDTTEDNIGGWDRFAANPCRFYAFSGGHFFIKEETAILNEIRAIAGTK